ncbi:MAG: DNA cytosine methyltransferase [Flavobacterium sp.]|nr:MAG: DNA cytosine methyltransferase [Flavobacterium sp.]
MKNKQIPLFKALTIGLIVFWIDLFCGAGGTSTGIHHSNANAKVIACVNHDAIAIASHQENHPDCLHLTEDIRDFAVVVKLKVLVDELRKKHPGCIINIWASLECTNHSKAKGGLSRDADSRTLADHLEMYLEHLNPDGIYIENVREFLDWGLLRLKEGANSTENFSELALDRKGKYVLIPDKQYLKLLYRQWRNSIMYHGYKYDYRLLDSANFGAYTSRLRYFAIFVKAGLPIAFPEPTHFKKGAGKKRWKAVKDVLDLWDEGVSIFNRKKALVDKTLDRIYAGLEKFVPVGGTFTKVYNSGNDQNRVKSVDEPIGALTTQNSHAVVKTIFIKKYFSGRPEGKVISVDGPAGTIKTVDGQAIVSATHFITQRNSGEPASKLVDLNGPARTLTATAGNQDVISVAHLNTYYGNGGQHSIDEPCPTLTTKDRVALVDAKFLDKRYGTGVPASINKLADTLTVVPKLALVSPQFIDQQFGASLPISTEQPLNTLTTKDKYSLVTPKPWLMDTNFGNVGSDIDLPAPTILASRKYHYLMNPQYESAGSSVENPCFTLIASMDKRPPYHVSAETGEGMIVIYENDSPSMVKIKEFMAVHGIIDVKMRMLKINEMLRIQGFPDGYVLKGTQTDQKKFIGNSVVPIMAQKLIEVNYDAVAEAQNLPKIYSNRIRLSRSGRKTNKVA